MDIEFLDAEKRRLRKEKREAGGLPSSMPVRAQSLMHLGLNQKGQGATLGYGSEKEEEVRKRCSLL
jgi:hypothetical protein